MKTRSHWLRRAKGFSQLAARRVAFSLLAALCLVNFGLYAVEVHAAEVHVAPGFNTLPEAVKANPGSTFILERGGAYVIDQDIVINVPTIIKAGPGDEALAPPVIQYSADQGIHGPEDVCGSCQCHF